MKNGFSMVELVIVIVVLAIGVVGIGSAFVYMSRSLSLNEELQRGWQVAQECAEHVMGQARKPAGSYASIPVGSPSTACDAVPPVAGYTRVVNVTVLPTGGALCSGGGWACKRVQITVQRTGGAALAALNFLIIDY